MNRFFVLTIAAILSISFSQAQSFFTSNEAPATSISPESTPKAGAATFATKVHNFGTIKKGEEVSFTFNLTNTGDGELLIENVKPSCSCTVPKYSKEPIKVGEEGYVKAVFTPKGPGAFNKTVTVRFDNDDAPVVLTIKGIAE